MKKSVLNARIFCISFTANLQLNWWKTNGKIIVILCSTTPQLSQFWIVSLFSSFFFVCSTPSVASLSIRIAALNVVSVWIVADSLSTLFSISIIIFISISNYVSFNTAGSFLEVQFIDRTDGWIDGQVEWDTFSGNFLYDFQWHRNDVIDLKYHCL